MREQEASHAVIAPVALGQTLPVHESRAVTRLSLRDVADALNLAYGAAHARAFAFLSDGSSAAREDGIVVPKEHLIWLASENDRVMLCDGTKRSVAILSRFDTREDRFYFLEPWPQRFLFSEGNNRIGVTAKHHRSEGERSQVSLSRDEFLRTAEGLVTVGGLGLPEQYLRAHYPGDAPAELLLRLGDALLSGEPDLDAADLSIALFERAAKDCKVPDLNVALAGSLFRALLHRAYLADEGEGDRNQKAIESHVAKYDEVDLCSTWRGEDFASVGRAARLAKRFDDCISFLSDAIRLQPDLQSAWLWRADAYFHLEDYDRAQLDLRILLAKNKEDLAFWKSWRASVSAPYAIFHGNLKIQHTVRLRLAGLETLFKTEFCLSHYDAAQAIAAELIALSPRRSCSYLFAAAAERALGRYGAMNELLDKAALFASDDSERDSFLEMKFNHSRAVLESPVFREWDLEILQNELIALVS